MLKALLFKISAVCVDMIYGCNTDFYGKFLYSNAYDPEVYKFSKASGAHFVASSGKIQCHYYQDDKKGSYRVEDYKNLREFLKFYSRQNLGRVCSYKAAEQVKNNKGMDTKEFIDFYEDFSAKFYSQYSPRIDRYLDSFFVKAVDWILRN